MAFFGKKDSAVLTRYNSVLAKKLHDEIQMIYRRYEPRLSKMDSREKLELLAAIKRSLDKSRLFSDGINEREVPIKAQYRLVYSLLFSPQGSSRSYFQMLGDSVNHANVAYAEIEAQEKHLLEELRKDRYVLNALSKDTVERRLVNDASFLRKGLLYAAMISFVLILDVFANPSNVAYGQQEYKLKGTITLAPSWGYDWNGSDYDFWQTLKDSGLPYDYPRNPRTRDYTPKDFVVSGENLSEAMRYVGTAICKGKDGRKVEKISEGHYGNIFIPGNGEHALRSTIEVFDRDMDGVISTQGTDSVILARVAAPTNIYDETPYPLVCKMIYSAANGAELIMAYEFIVHEEFATNDKIHPFTPESFGFMKVGINDTLTHELGIPPKDFNRYSYIWIRPSASLMLSFLIKAAVNHASFIYSPRQEYY